jgi:tripartite-type tricarboxylate transporter receptor subunit TctC
MLRKCLSGALVAAAVATLAWCKDASAQAYPDRSVRIIIAFAAGGTIDTLGRIVAQKLGEAWGQSVFVENRPGASGNIGAQAAAWRRSRISIRRESSSRSCGSRPPRTSSWCRPTRRSARSGS